MSEPKDDLVERDNHHNAATCPHCTDNGRFVLVEAARIEAQAKLIEGLREELHELVTECGYHLKKYRSSYFEHARALLASIKEQ